MDSGSGPIFKTNVSTSVESRVALETSFVAKFATIRNVAAKFETGSAWGIKIDKSKILSERNELKECDWLIVGKLWAKQSRIKEFKYWKRELRKFWAKRIKSLIGE